jgi:hypothetical protein
MYNRE